MNRKLGYCLLGLFMKLLVIKALLLITLSLAAALPVAPDARAESSRIVSTVLDVESNYKLISIPKGYRAIRADVTLLMREADKGTVKVVVGDKLTDLSWPDRASATLDLKKPEAVSSIPADAFALGAFPFAVNLEITCTRILQP